MPRRLLFHASRLLSLGRRLRAGIIGQGFSFLAMLLPIGFGKLDQLSFLVVVSSVAGIASYTFTWSYSSVYPSIKEAYDCRVSTISSLLLLVLTAIAMALVTLVGSIPVSLREITAWSAGLTLVIGLNLIITAILVRKRDFDSILSVRFVSGTLSFLLILAACLSDDTWRPLFVIATIIAFALSAGWGASKCREEFIGDGFQARVSLQEILAYFWQNAYAAFAAFLGGCAFQISGLSIPLLGPLAHAWAITLRLGGGFATVSQQVVAPLMEIDYSHFVRSSAAHDAIRLQRKAFLLGCSYAGMAATIVAVVIILSGSATASDGTTMNVLLAGSCLFTFSIISTSLITRNLVIAGGQREFLIWAAAKVLLGGVLLFSVSGIELLLGLTIVEALFQCLYFAIAARRLARLEQQGSARGAV